MFSSNEQVTVVHLLQKMRMLKVTKVGMLYFSVLFTVESFSPEITRIKHGVNYNSACRGIVFNGVCKACQAYVQGTTCYSFMVIIADTVDEDKTVKLGCADNAGTAIFGINAEAFHAQTEQQKDDSCELAMAHYYRGDVKIEYDAVNDVVGCILYGASQATPAP